MNLKTRALAALRQQQLDKVKEITGLIAQRQDVVAGRRVFMLDVSHLTPRQTEAAIKRWEDRMR